MNIQILSAVLIPFLGTCIGSAMVFFMRGAMNRPLQRMLTGFAAGVMVAASVWSLIIPAMEQSEHLGRLAFFPAFVGVWAGFGFLLLLDKLIPHMHLHDECPEGISCGLGNTISNNAIIYPFFISLPLHSTLYALHSTLSLLVSMLQ